MNQDKYTVKSMEAIREAQEIVIRNQNMQIDQQHLLYALTAQQEGGLIPQLITALNIDAAARADRLRARAFERIRQVYRPRPRRRTRCTFPSRVDAALSSGGTAGRAR